MITSEQIIADLTTVVRTTFPDRDYTGSIGAETRLFADIGLASIDLIVLAERLEVFYGRKLPFAAFLNELRKLGADDLELGRLITFLQRHVGPR